MWKEMNRKKKGEKQKNHNSVSIGDTSPLNLTYSPESPPPPPQPPKSPQRLKKKKQNKKAPHVSKLCTSKVVYDFWDMHPFSSALKGGHLDRLGGE